MGELLSRINSPSDLKKFNIEELERLSAEIREEIINVVSTNGGHLASNLGVVELTIAITMYLMHPMIRSSGMLDINHMPISY